MISCHYPISSLQKTAIVLRARATHLASSPRQREADTGARMLAILCAVLPTEEEREKNLKNLSQYLVKRLDLMAKSLGVAFNPRIEDVNLDDSEQMAIDCAYKVWEDGVPLLP